MESSVKYYPADIRKIKLLSYDHSQLIDIAENLNIMFVWQNLITCICALLELIKSLYDICLIPSQERIILYDMLFGSTSFLTVIFNLMIAFYPSHYCEKFKYEIDLFNKKLFYCLNSKSNFGIVDARLQYYSLMKRSITFTAGGFFNLGYPLITTVSFNLLESLLPLFASTVGNRFLFQIITSVATYLIIIIQFTV
ncbi:hypothetical protein O3M35_000420 [Rhynocoris fuscipes]|uniref:Uncharacterized protein n=1 Tax=Rhynocoris fuscipes TaxID=488301 RepID=A0AAW1DLD1_9HEMI